MLGFLPYHEKWGEVLSNALWIFSYINFFWCFWCAAPFVLMLITVNNTWSNHYVNDYVVYFIISVYPWCITTISFHGYDEFINQKVGDICWFYQGAILINSHKFAWMLFVLKKIRMKLTMQIGDYLNELINTQSILFFAHITVIM